MWNGKKWLSDKIFKCIFRLSMYTEKQSTMVFVLSALKICVKWAPIIIIFSRIQIWKHYFGLLSLMIFTISEPYQKLNITNISLAEFKTWTDKTNEVPFFIHHLMGNIFHQNDYLFTFNDFVIPRVTMFYSHNLSKLWKMWIVNDVMNIMIHN